MIPAADVETDRFLTTNGEIALINLESARQRSWSRFFADPQREAVAESIVEHEQLTARFVGDVCALDRLDFLAQQLNEIDPQAVRTALIRARIASMAHRFAEARHYLTRAELSGAPTEEVSRIRLNLDQACGVDLDGVLWQRREMARNSTHLEDLVALGALLGDLRQFSEANDVYLEAVRGYRDVSPFPLAWSCFQLGMLWGELVPERQVNRAAKWYQRAIDYLPGYTKARVHLAEIHSANGRVDEAQALLVPAIASGDPEVRWRLADAMVAEGKSAHLEMQAAQSGFESLLERHLLAYADHGAEFYAGSGNNWSRALELASINVANRPTLRAFEQAYMIAVGAGETDTASELLAQAVAFWGGSSAFQSSALAKHSLGSSEGAAA